MEGYRGSLILSPLAERLGLQVDQVNFLAGQLGGLAVGVLFRRRLRPGHVTSTTRHVVSAVVGVSLLLLCYGRETVHVVNQAALTYILMRLVPAHSVHRACLFAAMLYLSRIHYWRLWVRRPYMDISGPMMVMTMKTTLLACNIHDGSPAGSDNAKNKPNLRSIALSEPPSLLEFVGYAFSFQNLLVGPMIDFHHYSYFIKHGTSPACQTLKAGPDGNANVIGQRPAGWPPVATVLRCLLTAAVASACVLLLVPLLPHSKFLEEEYHSWSLSRQWGYMYLAGFAARMKYYTAWSLAEAVCCASGLGFNGLSPDGRQRWDAAANVDVWKIECGSSFRDSLLGWNLGTARWLRLVAYERVKGHRTLAVYVLSALWHGLNPGYYLAFSIGGLCTQADRLGRRHLWPHCQQVAVLRWFYCACAFIGARACFAYFHIAFELLNLRGSLQVWWDTYFILHIICVAMIVVLPWLFPSQKPASHSLVPGPPESSAVQPSTGTSSADAGDRPQQSLSRSTAREAASGEAKSRRHHQWVPELPRSSLTGSVCPGNSGAALANRAAKFHVL